MQIKITSSDEKDLILSSDNLKPQYVAIMINNEKVIVEIEKLFSVATNFKYVKDKVKFKI